VQSTFHVARSTGRRSGYLEDRIVGSCLKDGRLTRIDDAELDFCALGMGHGRALWLDGSSCKFIVA
jgi:hypothetical protein